MSNIFDNDIESSLDEASMIQKDTEVNIPEAPAVANIRVWINGYGVIFTVRGEKMNDIVKKTTSLVEYAESHGWKNTWNTDNKTPQGTTVPQKQSNAPICAVHGTPMTERIGNYGKFWSCATKNADGSWCKFKPPKE